MAGHSHWARIKRKKAVVDSRRGRLWSKLARNIIVAARSGGGDPDQNLKLRYAIDKAKEANMPKDTIDKAVKRGSGAMDGADYDEVIYEGYGPAGVAVMASALTDNRNRTGGELRKIFERSGGSLGSTNCVAFSFSRRGVFAVRAEDADEERILELAIAGDGDYRLDGNLWEITCEPERFDEIKASLEGAGVKTEVAEVGMVPASTVTLDADNGRKVLTLMEALEDHDDIQDVFSNFDIPQEVMDQLGED
ncbi:MAG: YebC/PmpR family DNA-binding transcriptional regulator [Phycisphaerae bacterium]|nr:YebC/PmpR family DNA-binding transcriptional regulator [Phycisphaerae bacterium]